jgi:hypothetical protein
MQCQRMSAMYLLWLRTVRDNVLEADVKSGVGMRSEGIPVDTTDGLWPAIFVSDSVLDLPDCQF